MMIVNFILEDEITKLKIKFKAQELRLKKLVPDMFSLKEELHESQKRYSDFYDFNASIYFSIDKQYIIRDLNFQAARLLNIDRQLVMNKLFLNFMSGMSQAAFKDNIKALTEENLKQICNIELLQKGGVKKQVVMESTLLENDLIRLCILDVTDNNHLVEQVFELEQSLSLIDHLFQMTTEASAAMDSTFNIIVLNQAFNDFFTHIFTIKPLKGMNLITGLARFPEIQLKIREACLQALDKTKSSVMIESPCINSTNDSYYCYEFCITSLFHQENQKKELLIHIKNLTDFKLQEMTLHKIQADIARSWRTRAMGEMACALTHEINQPLTALIAYSQSCLFLINKQSSHEKTISQLLIPLKQIASQAEHAGEVMNSMKKFIREGSLRTELTDINLLIKDTLSILKYELLDFQMKVTLNLMENLPEIMTNKISIMQVLLNLARNGIEALQKDTQENPELIIKTFQSTENIIVQIYDNGPGVPEEFRNKILNTYFTTKPQGTGIGLGICRALLDEHGGTLNFLQTEGSGACFMFTLPILNKKVDA